MIRMSTKIYNGFALPLMSLKELTTFSQDFRVKAKKVAIEQAEKFLAGRIAHKLDQLCLLGEEVFIAKHVKQDEESLEKATKRYQVFGAFTHEYQKAYYRYQEVQRTNYRDAEVDLDANIVYIPMQDKTLALFYGENEQIRALWEQEDLVSYYGYWNNVDPDEDCSEEQWEQRKRDWDEALPGYTLPLEAGLIAEFVKGYPSKSELSSERIVSYIPTTEVRAKKIAKGLVADEKARQMQAAGETSGYQLAIGSREYLQTEEGEKRVNNMTDEIQVKLLPLISEEHLKTSYQALKKTLL